MYILQSQLNATFSDPSPLVSAKSGKSPSALDLELPSSSFPEASGPGRFKSNEFSVPTYPAL